MLFPRKWYHDYHVKCLSVSRVHLVFLQVPRTPWGPAGLESRTPSWWWWGARRATTAAWWPPSPWSSTLTSSSQPPRSSPQWPTPSQHSVSTISHPAPGYKYSYNDKFALKHKPKIVFLFVIYFLPVVLQHTVNVMDYAGDISLAD